MEPCACAQALVPNPADGAPPALVPNPADGAPPALVPNQRMVLLWLLFLTQRMVLLRRNGKSPYALNSLFSLGRRNHSTTIDTPHHHLSAGSE